MALEGDLRIFRLPDILQVISQQQKTGILTVQGEQDILAVSFLRGDIVAADALNQNFEHGLGEVLASQGLVRPEELARIFDEQRSSGRRLADFLVDKGLLSRAQLLDALRDLTYRLLLQVLRWTQGEFKFYSGEEVSYEEGFAPIPVAEVLMRSLGDLMGEGTLSGTLPHGFVAYERATSARPIRVIGRDGTPPPEAGNELWVSADEQELLDRLDGEMTAEAVGKASGLGDYRTLYGLFRLLQAGLVRPSGAPMEAGSSDSGANAGAVSEGVRDGRSWRPSLTIAGARRAHDADIEVPADSAEASREIWVGRLLAAAAALLVVALAWMLALRPAAVVLPFPWMRDDRAAFERQQRRARALAIDRAARTHFLLEGRYPDRLAELVERGLLGERCLQDPSGKPLQFRSDAISYSVEGAPGRAGETLAVSETISGDFVIDPEFFRGLREDEGNPLILLD